MTREEKQKAIDALKISAPIMAVTQEEFNTYIQTLNKVMDWLEQDDVLEKIRAEIEEERDTWDKWEQADYYYSYDKCLEIIDEYKTESEE